MADHPAAVTLLSEISEKIKGSGDAIRQKVVESRVNSEVNKRADALDKALGVRSQVASEIKKLEKPDQEVFGADGSVMHSGFSKERVKELEKARQRLGKIDKCIAAALDNNEWGKLNEVK